MASLARLLKFRFGGGNSDAETVGAAPNASVELAPSDVDDAESRAPALNDAVLTACVTLARSYADRASRSQANALNSASAPHIRAVNADFRACADGVQALARQLDAHVAPAEPDREGIFDALEGALAALGVAYSRVMLLDGRAPDAAREQLVCGPLREQTNALRGALAELDKRPPSVKG